MDYLIKGKINENSNNSEKIVYKSDNNDQYVLYESEIFDHYLDISFTINKNVYDENSNPKIFCEYEQNSTEEIDTENSNCIIPNDTICRVSKCIDLVCGKQLLLDQENHNEYTTYDYETTDEDGNIMWMYKYPIFRLELYKNQNLIANCLLYPMVALCSEVLVTDKYYSGTGSEIEQNLQIFFEPINVSIDRTSGNNYPCQFSLGFLNGLSNANDYPKPGDNFRMILENHYYLLDEYKLNI